MTCNNCGAALESTATTCPVCGTTVVAAAGEPSRPAWETGEGGGEWSGAAHGGGDWSGAGHGGAAPGGAAPGAAPGAAWQAPRAPHPSGLPSDIRGWGIGAHASAYLTFIGLPIVGPLLVWLIKRDHPFVDHHGKEALNFNLSVALYTVVLVAVSFPLAFLTVGLALIPIGALGLALAVWWLIVPVVGCVKASNGEGYRYPMTIRFVR